MRENWTYKKLGEVCEIVMGQSPDGNSINENEGIEFHQGKTCFGERFLSHSSLYTSKPAKYAEANSVLLCVRAPVGFPNITKRRICIGRGLCSLVGSEEITNMFLFYSLLGKQGYFEKNSTGSTFKAISSKVISDVDIPIPPLSEQQSIVAELDKINELINLKKAQLSDLDNLAQSIFYDMFGDPIENEKGWGIKALGSIADFKNGLNFSKEESGNCYKFLGVSDFQDNRIVCSDSLNIIHLNDSISEEYLLQTGDIVFVRSNGSKELVGRNILMQITEPTTFSGFCIRCRLSDNDFNSVYLSFLLKAPSMRPVITNSGRGCNISNLNQKILSALPIIYPPLSLQQEFAKRIELIEQQKAQICSTIKDLETLLASRMQHWFD
ncbi:restriction endonuclease subunit S [Prevotella communis]|uniref:restriction endonuclease subunit S n=1 Tax=Prevotella communis TaxID=2913614 RepID=UPI001EDA42EC|nr:restriction endonuclease subunit S [Prevotella communis]UKK66875.1 restriction endonuclease subunit S [Prevotella communis]UKK70984.1 restriction endonuclease subunit S [Prevotella communis]